ncbi:hypothetical protein FRC09_002353 [Ceratobasidium sp. 395]|nr:hypothetical protein FRC09_002353 [Ceratobasidium sp. 395]
MVKLFHRQRKSVQSEEAAAISSLAMGLDNEPGSRLHALVIGIDLYAELNILTGAVADADAITSFLEDDLKVPRRQIINLRNELASRAAIIQALQEFRENPGIQIGDPILIFYAGHGGLGQAKQQWKTEYGYDQIQVIFPCDYGTKPQGSKEIVNCIPDRTIRILLNGLAEAKGNNITVIFDCCHSASGSRVDDIEDSISSRIARDANVQVTVPYDIDSDIVSPTAQPLSLLQRKMADSRSPKLPLYTDQASHIHLAACGSEEKAWEEGGRGVFTTALLSYIQASRINKITYQNLLDALPSLPKQTPHCYGIHKSRILFNSRIPSRKTTLVPVRREQDAWILQAGIASGVTKGSVWELYDQPTEDSRTLGLLHAHTPKVSSTVLEGDIKYPCSPSPMTLVRTGLGRLYARLIRPGTGHELRVYFSPEAKSLVFPPGCDDDATDTEAAEEQEIGYTVFPSPGKADIIVEVYHPADATSDRRPLDTEPEVTFTLRNSQAEMVGMAKLKNKTRARRDEVEAVLFAAARWNWHLKRIGPSRARSVVSLELMKLGTMYGDYMMPVDEPLENLNKAGLVDIKVKEEDQYGVKLSSQARVPLYIRVFYFDSSDFSILDMFGHSRANGHPDPDIPAHGQLMIGDGSNSGALLSFGLAPGTELEMGFIKVFWSTDPLELDDVAQDSGFGFSTYGETSGRRVTLASRNAPKDWGTILLTMVQRA